MITGADSCPNDQFALNDLKKQQKTFLLFSFLLNIYMENKEMTIADLTLLKDIIDLASTRGAFRAAEMKEVGEVYEKLTNFLDAIVEQAKAQEQIQAVNTQGE